MSKIMKMAKSKRLESEEEMTKIMKMPRPKRHESEEEEDWDEDDFEEEEEESEERDEFKANVAENFDPNTITVKVQKFESGSYDLKFMKINKEIELRWFMIYYCESTRMEYRNTKFMFNGARLRNGDTPLKLSIVDGDIISVCPKNYDQGIDPPSPIGYQTLCIRAHKGRDTFVRVARNEPLLRSFKRNSSDNRNGKHDSTCYFYNRHKLNDLHTAEMIGIKDGDIIDAFNFDDHRSSLSFVSGLPSTIRQPPTFKENPDVNKSGPSKNSLGTPGTRSLPTLMRRNLPVQQPTTKHRSPPVVRYESSPFYAGRIEFDIDATTGIRLV